MKGRMEDGEVDWAREGYTRASMGEGGGQIEEWMDGFMDDCNDRWMAGWTDRCLDGWTVRMARQIRQNEKLKAGQMDGWVDAASVII